MKGSKILTLAMPLGNCTCGKEIYAVISGDENTQGLIHEEPFCKKFKELDCLDFLQWLRFARTDPEGKLQ